MSYAFIREKYAALVKHIQDWRKIFSIGETYSALAKHTQHWREICSIGETYLEQPGEDDRGGGRIFPEHPSPILHAPRDNILRKGNPSLRYREYIGIHYLRYIKVRPCLASPPVDLSTFDPNAAYVSPMLHMFRQC